jgi:hypothetical protein
MRDLVIDDGYMPKRLKHKVTILSENCMHTFLFGFQLVSKWTQTCECINGQQCMYLGHTVGRM